MMYAVYSFLFGLWAALMCPVLAYRAIRKKKYLPNIPMRLGKLPGELRHDGRTTIWIHACSVGEALSAQPLACELHARFPEARLVFSTVTRTGQAVARERFEAYGPENVFYFPLDFATVANRVLDWIQPSLLITIDTEIWPNVLHETHRRGIPIVLVNGRISAKSFRYYVLAQPALARVFENYSALLMQSRLDAERIQRLGARPSRIDVIGNIKYDRGAAESGLVEAKSRAIDAAFGITEYATPILVAGSTHDDEEKTLLDVLREVRADDRLAKTRLLLVPRHPERFDDVAALAEREGFTVQRRSDSRGPNPAAEILLLDTLGELGTAYRFASVAFVGGTLIPHGGQSIMEPATWGRAIVTGPHMENFTDIIGEFQSRQAVVQIDADENDKPAQRTALTREITRLLLDPSAAESLGRAAHAIFEESQGATQRAVDRIEPWYRKRVAG
ncbi:MAG: 3-deoxy-D-manno-octulosonic acid transferase [Capsulimonadaceae bacterium]